MFIHFISSEVKQRIPGTGSHLRDLGFWVSLLEFWVPEITFSVCYFTSMGPLYVLENIRTSGFLIFSEITKRKDTFAWNFSYIFFVNRPPLRMIALNYAILY